MAGMLAPLLALAMIQSSPYKAQQGSVLYRDCLVAQHHANGKVRSGNDPSDGTYCVDYMTRFLDVTAKERRICMGDYTVKAFIAKYLIYMQKHHELMKADEEKGADAAFMASFSCAL
jgi:hypothetical protein